MFTSKTVFVVGAGASCEVGLPSGEELTRQIPGLLDIRFGDGGFTQMSGDRVLMDVLRRHVKETEGPRGDVNQYLHAAWRIRDAMPQAMSIDSFIDAHRDDGKVELCGKLAIAKSILSAERNSRLYIDPHRREGMAFGNLTGTWFGEFLKLLVDGVAKGDIGNIFDNVSFIIFNYDRCIEHYLVNAIANYYAISTAEAQKIVGKLEIIHPYGVVGDLPWQSTGGLHMEFGSDYWPKLLNISGRIKTFTEQIEEESILRRVRESIEQTDAVVFLGFAFHDQNMELMSISEMSSVRRVFATTKDVSDSDAGVIHRNIHRLLRQPEMHPQAARIELKDTTCFGLFKEYRRSLTS
jgi:hypothetical protein